MLDLTDRVVLVTGASSGFGEATALKFARRGARVALLARSADRLDDLARRIGETDGQAVSVPTDIGRAADLESAHAKVVRTLGHVEILVNNAGMNVPNRSVQDTTMAEWERIMDVNLKAAFQLTKLVLPEMKRRRRGTIVNVASRAANYPGLLSGVAYSSSKLGMRALNTVTNEEANPFNVRAILINPGVGATPILDRRPEPPPLAERERMLQAEDIADTIVFSAMLPYRACLELVNVYPTSPDVQ